MSMIHINQGNFEKEIMKSDAPVIVDFWASWCGPCQMMGPVFEELSKQYKGKLKFAKLNTEEEPELAGMFGIRGIPTLIMVNQGKNIESLVGFRPKNALKTEIERIMSTI